MAKGNGKDKDATLGSVTPLGSDPFGDMTYKPEPKNEPDSPAVKFLAGVTVGCISVLMVCVTAWLAQKILGF